MNKYRFIIKCKKTHEIVSTKLYSLEKTQSELDEIIKNHNANENLNQYHEQVFDNVNCKLVDMMEDLKPKKDIDDVYRCLDDMVDEMRSTMQNIEDYLETIKKE